MAILNDLQKQQIIQKEASVSAEKILEYIQRFDNLSLEDFPAMDSAKRTYIQDKINSAPNPLEQQEWSAIQPLMSTPSQDLLNALNQYIRNWESTRPTGNHVDEAWQHVENVEKQLDAIQRQLEENDWNNVDMLNQMSLLKHLHKYPRTAHKNEIDDSVWALVDRENIQEIQDYISAFPMGLHINEARELLNSIVEWNNVKNSNDILYISEYLRNNPNTPFRQQATLLIASLKQVEISEMRNNPNNYEASRLLTLLEEGIFTDRELIMAKVATENVLQSLKNTNIRYDLPNINQAIESSIPECKDGYTDVYFFGVPSTGKTCVLMGMSRSNSLNINLAHGGGDYAEALQQYTDVGITVPRTPGTFVTTLEATIRSQSQENAEHKVNLVEMSGEEFAFDIAKNENKIYSFEEMGSGATKLLSNDNRKVFFLIVDPTTNIVRITREVIVGYDEETGEPIKRLENCVVNQRTIIQKIVNIFEQEQNADIMKKVDSIHIIMTKADTLGNAVEREDRAQTIFYDKYANDILQPLKDLCKEYNINSNTNFSPRLYTFSLGTFYVGGLYEYDPTDSNRLVKAIRNSTQGTKKKTFWDRLKSALN